MTQDKGFKRLVRQRMVRTGESYTAARAQLLKRRSRSKGRTLVVEIAEVATAVDSVEVSKPSKMNVVCASCALPLTEKPSPVQKREPCPQCGSRAREFAVEVNEPTRAREAIAGKVKRKGFRSGGRRRPAVEFFSGDDQSADGSWARKDQLIDRERDHYSERVVLADGTIARDVKERLTEHVGRGSAKVKKQRSRGAPKKRPRGR